MLPKEKLSLRVDALEKELKILKLEASGTAENNIWYSYRSEVHKIFSKINHILFWLILISFILSFIPNYTDINKTPFIIIISILLCSIATILIYPFIVVFFHLRIYLQLKNPKKFINALSIITGFLYRSLTTFVIVFSFPFSLYFLIKIVIFNNIISKIKDLNSDELAISIDLIMQGKELSIIMCVLMVSLVLFTHEASSILMKSYLQAFNNKWKNYKPTYIFFINSLLLIAISMIWSLSGEMPVLIKATEDDLNAIGKGYATRFVIDGLVSSYQIYLLLGAFILHTIGLLISEYFVDKKYIEEYNVPKK